jgi:hypothetical protein
MSTTSDRQPTPSKRGAPSGRADQNTTPQPALPAWRPVSARQKLWLLLLTLATVAGLAYVLQRPHQQLVQFKAARHAAECRGDVASRPPDCPGARMPVMVLPAAAPPSR